MLKIIKVLGIALGVLVGLVAVLAVGLVVALERGWLDERLSRFASAQLGREVTLRGGVDLSFGRDLVIGLGPLTIGNPDWAGPEPMARIERVTAAVRLTALLRGEIVLPQVTVIRPEAGLVRLADGRANWQFGTSDTPPADQGSSTSLPRIEHLRVESAAVGFEDQLSGARLTARLDEVDGQGGGDLPVRLDAHGTLADQPLVLRARSGPLASTSAPSGRVPLEAFLTVGDTRAAAEGSLAKPGDFDSLALEAALETGESTGALLQAFGAGMPGVPAVQVKARVEPTNPGSRIVVDGRLGQDELHARATLARLTEPMLQMDATAVAGGEHLAELLGHFGTTTEAPLPPWRVLVRATGENGALELQTAEASLGANRVAARGRIAQFAGLQGLDLAIDGEAPELPPVLQAFGVAAPQDLPTATLATTVTHDGNIWALPSFRLAAGENHVEGTARVEDPTGAQRIEAHFAGELREPGPLLALAGIEVLPTAPVTLALDATPAGQATHVTAAARLEGEEVILEADIVPPVTLPDRFTARLMARGERLGLWFRLAGIELPSELPPYALTAEVDRQGQRFELKALAGNLGENKITGNAVVADIGTLAGVEAHLAVDAPAPGMLLPVLGSPERDLPPLQGAVDLAPAESGSRGAIKIAVGEDHLDGDVLLPRGLTNFDEVTVSVSAAGERLAELLALGGVAVEGELPAYALDARLQRQGKTLVVEALQGHLGENTINGQGRIEDLSALAGLDFHLEADLPRLTELARKFGVTDRVIPDAVLTADGSRDADGNRLAVNAEFGSDRLELVATNAGAFTDLATLRLEVKARGTNLGQFLPLVGLTEQPVPSYRLDATVAQREEGGTALDVDAALGTTQLSANGVLAALSGDAGVEIDARIKGEDTSDILEIFGLPGISLPPYDVRGHVVRDGQVIRVTGLNGVVADSDVKGTASVDLAQDPVLVTGDLSSDRLDFDDLAPLIGAPPDTTETASAEQRQQAAQLAATERVLPDVEISPEAWQRLNIDIRYRGRRVNAPDLPIQNLAFHVVSRKGVLTLDPFSAEIARGRINAFAHLDGTRRPMRADLDVRINGLELRDFLGEFDIADYGFGRLSGRVQAKSRGESVRELAAAADGRLALDLAGGRLDAVLLEAAGLDLAEAVGVLFFDQDEDPGEEKVELRCVIADFDLQSGVMQARTLLLDTPDDKITGEGTIDLRDETLDLIFRVFPRDTSLASLRVPVRIAGKIREPEIIPAPQGIKNKVLAWVLAPLAAVVPFVELGAEDDHPCNGVLERVREESRVQR